MNDPSNGDTRQTPSDVTAILARAAEGETAAAAELLPLVYQQLRAVAQQRMAAENPEHTLQATALVHEAYMRLVGERRIPWQGRAHFYAAAAEAMRRVLLDHAKGRGRQKRGGGRRAASFEVGGVADLAAAEKPEEILAFDEAFRRLEDESPEAARVVRLRFYAGLSVDETANALDVSPRTVNRLWAFARAWLYDELHDG